MWAVKIKLTGIALGKPAARLVDWVARITLSLVTYPEEFLNDEEALRRYLRRFLIPSIIKDAAISENPGQSARCTP